MNSQSPIDQNALHFYRGNFATLRARFITFHIARVTLRKKTISSYTRKLAFSAYKRQLKLLFEDGDSLGQAIRTASVDDEPPTDSIRRFLYYECNFKIYLHIYRSFTSENSGMVDARGVTKNDGRALSLLLVKFN